MKTLLINPPLTRFGEPVDIVAAEPLGLLYLAAYLRENKKEVDILDAYRAMPSVEDSYGFYRSGISKEDIEEYIDKSSPDIVGITSMFTVSSRGVHETARIVKKISKDIFVVVGGAHPSSLPKEVLDDGNIDMAVIGEGEETLLEIVERLENRKPLSNIAGTALIENGQVRFNPPRPLIRDLDSLPLPARDLLDMKPYLEDKLRNILSMSPPRANLITSRGCPFNCIFCSIHAIWKNSYRSRSPKMVLEELRHLVKTYDIREVAFMDDNLTFDRDRMARICNLILHNGLDIHWCTPNGVSIMTLDRDILNSMKKSGCYKLDFGIETASKETQKFIRKSYIDLEKSKEIIKYCNKIGIWTHSAFIIGFIYETKEMIEETIRYAIDSDLDMATFYIATPLPGSELYRIYVEEGLISKTDFNPRQGRPTVDSKYLTKEELVKIQREAYRKFYISRIPKFFNPLRLIRKGVGIDESWYFLKLMINLKSCFKVLT